MEFEFELNTIFNIDKIGLSVIRGDRIFKKNQKLLSFVLDEIGIKSATVRFQILTFQAQGLKTPVTTGTKFLETDQRIYLKCEGNAIIGFLKMGVKKLFIHDEFGTIREISPLCVLDFYVHENFQRTGVGKVK